MKTGVYGILCAGNQKFYIGSAVNINARWSSHRSMLRKNAHSNKHLQNSWNKYGQDSFVFEVLEPCAKHCLIEREQRWIDALRPHDPAIGMNNSPTATTRSGFRHSDETIKKLRALALTRDHSHLVDIAHRMRGLPAHNRGVPGKKATDEMRAKMSASRRGRPAWNRGVPHSAESKDKISASVSASRTRYGNDIAAKIFDMRARGYVWREISAEVKVSIAQCCKIGSGKRKFDKMKAAGN